MRISDWSSDVGSSDLHRLARVTALGMAIASPPMNHLSLGAAMSIAKISLVVTALLASATAANANIITVSAADIGNSYKVDYDGFTEGQVIGGHTRPTTFHPPAAPRTRHRLANP